jgi:ketosteroid isomerase-like protein
VAVASRQLARRVYDAANRAAGTGDYDEWLGFFDPAVEWRPLDGQNYRGLEGITAWFEDWRRTMDEIHWQVEEEHDAGEDDAVLLVHVTARIRGTERPLDTRYALWFQIADGKVMRLTEFHTREEALAAAGGGG